jgi:putative hydrolase of the HAD superfamily
MVRALLFDMGNVLLHFSHDRMYEQIGALVGRSADETRRVCERAEWLSRSDMQIVSDDDTARELGGLFGVRLDAKSLWLAVSDIFWPNETIDPIVRQLAGLGLPMVLVSNTCSAHMRWVTGRFSILDHFPKKILSFEVGAAKPSDLIFAAAARAAGCPAADCLFVDDTPGHVEAARRIGFDAVRYESTEQLVCELHARGINLTSLTNRRH